MRHILKLLQGSCVVQHGKYTPSVRITLRRLHELGILNEGDRAGLVAEIIEYCVAAPSDLALVDQNITPLLSEGERVDAFSRLKSEVIPSLEDVIEQWGEDYDSSTDPEAYFSPLWTTLDSLGEMLLADGDVVGYDLVKAAEKSLQYIVDDAESKYRENEEPDYDHDSPGSPSGSYDRDPFDDVDQ